MLRHQYGSLTTLLLFPRPGCGGGTTYLWNIYSNVPSYIGGSPPLSTCVPTRLHWAKTSLQSGRAPRDSTLTEEGARQEERDSCISLTVKRGKKTLGHEICISDHLNNSQDTYMCASAQPCQGWAGRKYEVGVEGWSAVVSFLHQHYG